MSDQGHILIADDEETFLHATAELLRQEGYTCDCVADGVSAAAWLRDGTYDVLIADIRMPGNRHLEMIRDLPEYARGLPVILVTGQPTMDSAVQAIQLPVVAYLVKPLDFDELLAHIRTAIARTYTYRAVGGLQQRVDAESELVPVSTDVSLSKIDARVKHIENLMQTLIEGPKATDTGKDAAGQQFQLESLEELQSLSHREWQVLQRLYANQRVPSIAQALALSPHTVRNHLKSIFRKVGVRSQSELLALLEEKRTQETHLS